MPPTTSQTAAREAVTEGDAVWQALRAHWPGYVMTIDGANRLMSHNTPEALGPHGSLGRDLLEPLSSDDAAAMRALYDSVRASGKSATSRTKVALPGQPPRWYECSCMPLRDRGDDALLLLVNDVTEYAQAEETLAVSERRFRALIEKSGEGILLRDADGTTTYASPGAAALLGVTVAEVPATLRDCVYHPDDQERIAAAEEQVRARPGASVVAEFRIAHRDGTWHWIETTRTNLLDDPAVRAVVCNFRDVTERRLMADELVHAQKMEAIGRLAGGVAHDFNNVLAAILMHAELCASEIANPERLAEDLAELREIALRATGVTRQLLAFTRKQAMQPRHISLNALVSEIHRMLQRLIGEDIHLEPHLAPDLGTVRCDPTHLTQVLLNLVVNARDAMPRGGCLTIATANVELNAGKARTLGSGISPGSYVELTVTDTGTGMDDATLRRLFEPFFTTKVAGKGTGLGLSMVLGIVQQSGGAIVAESGLGRGSTFRVYLPRAEAAVSSLPPAPAVAHRRGASVLLAEDDPATRDALTRLLEQRGFRVRSASSLAEAVVLLDERPADVLVTDMIMGDGDGPTLATLARARQPGIRVLFMSGYANHEILEKQLADTTSAFLAKPFTVEQLESALDALAA